jgi:plasmid maintenance system antidote protein VapI
MALRVGQLCGNGPEIWLNLQAKYDLAQARARSGADLARISHSR